MSKAHPDPAEWLDLLRDRLARDRAIEVRRHLRAGCSRCEAVRDWAERVLASADEPLEEPPAGALSRARALFRTHRPRGLAEGIRTLVASLLPSPLPEPVAAREASPAELPRTWEAGPYLVEVMIDPAPRGRRTTVRGRIVDRQSGLGVPGLARFHRSGKLRAQGSLDDLGEIILRDVVPAGGELELLVGGDRVSVEL